MNQVERRYVKWYKLIQRGNIHFRERLLCMIDCWDIYYKAQFQSSFPINFSLISTPSVMEKWNYSRHLINRRGIIRRGRCVSPESGYNPSPIDCDSRENAFLYFANSLRRSTATDLFDGPCNDGADIEQVLELRLKGEWCGYRPVALRVSLTRVLRLLSPTSKFISS